MAATQYLWDRQYAITIGIPGQQGSRYGNIPSSSGQTASLRVVFDIDRTSQSVSNKAKFEVYNLNSNSRQQYDQKGQQIQFDAGFVGLTGTIFIGDVAFSKAKRAADERKLELGQKSNTRLATSEKRQGGHIITTFECGDGEKFLLTARLHKNYPKNTTYLSVLQDVANIVGVNNLSVGQVMGIKNQLFPRGLTVDGHLKNVLDRLTALQDLEWSIQNGQLQIIPKNAHTGDQAIVLSPTTGLLGVPTRGSDHTEFTALLNPQIKPGGYVQIFSENINGEFFKIRRAHFQGDTHGNKWEVACEAVKINAVQTLVSNAGTTLRAGA